MKEYAFYIGDEYLSEKFTDITLLCDRVLEEIDVEDWIHRDEKGQFVLVDIVETVDYEDRIDCDNFIELLINDACKELGEDVGEWYLKDVDVKDFELEINDFWKRYKKTRNINTIHEEKRGTKKTYKLYVEEKVCGYDLVSYEVLNGNKNS